ncbi:helix-turn-helix domain-containing protein [Oceanospirillum beijerinckii]|uniref:helix-turn-helix domain-containing protein n=1 Tax=Oceanospirillum beijerinckii TaxID=64976 RepID=UPI000415B35B|nr:helix-turn-helix domain-containing protein [Oceanospirillum beijerinckii]
MQQNTLYMPDYLDPFVRQIWLWQSEISEALPVILPGTGTELIFNLGAPIELTLNGETRHLYQDAIIICPRKHRITLSAHSKVRLLSVRFRSSGFYQMFRIPMTELTDHLFSFSECFSSDQLPPIFDPELSNQQCILHLKQWLEQRLEQMKSPNAFSGIVDQVYYRYGGDGLAEIKTQAACSERSFQRKFRLLTGVDARYFSRTARFQHTLKHLLKHKKRHFSDAPGDHTFYDQAHFIKEFRHFTGQPPMEYLKGHHSGLNYYSDTPEVSWPA